MRAILQHGFGDPTTVLKLGAADRPEPLDHEVLVRVRASSVNAGDWLGTVGRPYVMRPTFGVRRRRPSIPGKDVAGTVEAVGASVTAFVPGDEVYGELTRGGFGEYVAANPKMIARAPRNLSHAQAAAVPLAGMTALQGIRDAGGVESGKTVLVIGASGGVGTFAVQIASALGAHVTGVCSTRNLDFVRDLGADAVVDYTSDDFSRAEPRYDVVLDLIGSHKVGTMRRLLTAEGMYVAASGRPGGDFLGPLPYFLRAGLASLRRSGPQVRVLVTKTNADDLLVLTTMIETKLIAPVIDRACELAQVPDAIAYQGAGHTQGKTVINIG